MNDENNAVEAFAWYESQLAELREAVRVLAEEANYSRRTWADEVASPNVRTHRRLTDQNPISRAAIAAVLP